MSLGTESTPKPTESGCSPRFDVQSREWLHRGARAGLVIVAELGVFVCNRLVNKTPSFVKRPVSRRGSWRHSCVAALSKLTYSGWFVQCCALVEALPTRSAG